MPDGAEALPALLQAVVETAIEIAAADMRALMPQPVRSARRNQSRVELSPLPAGLYHRRLLGSIRPTQEQPPARLDR